MRDHLSHLQCSIHGNFPPGTVATLMGKFSSKGLTSVSPSLRSVRPCVSFHWSGLCKCINLDHASVSPAVQASSFLIRMVV